MIETAIADGTWIPPRTRQRRTGRSKTLGEKPKMFVAAFGKEELAGDVDGVGKEKMREEEKVENVQWKDILVCSIRSISKFFDLSCYASIACLSLVYYPTHRHDPTRDTQRSPTSLNHTTHFPYPYPCPNTLSTFHKFPITRTQSPTTPLSTSTNISPHRHAIPKSYHYRSRRPTAYGDWCSGAAFHWEDR